MNNIIPFSDKKIIQEQASNWFAKLHRGELSQEERSDLHHWLMHNPRHGTALIQMAELWDDMSSLSLLAELMPLTGEPHIDSPARSFLSMATLTKPTIATITAIAASLVLIISVMFPLDSMPLVDDKGSPLSEPYELVYHTKLGDQSLAHLKDGSTILLNTQTTVKVRYSDKERTVELVEGEAHFEVAKNSDIPFVVYAGNGSIRAVGTAFSVRLDEQRVGVTVTEGTVRVNSGAEVLTKTDTKVNVTAVTLTQNGEAFYSDSIENVGYIEPQLLEKKLAWQTGKWVFEGERLEDVIKEANRYLDIKLVIGDPAIASLQVGGYFDVGDIEPFLSALERGLGVTALPQNGGKIALIASSHR